MNPISILTNTRYLNTLMILLGMSFQLSMAATNTLFYLTAVSGLALTFSALKNHHESLRQILRSPLWQLVTVWIILLYVSAFYSQAGSEQLGEFAKKYLRYVFVGCFALLVITQMRQGNDLIRRFFLGFALGGALTFILSLINKSTTWLSALAYQGAFPIKYVYNDYWVSNELFAHALFMAILFAYGLLAWVRGQKGLAVICCCAGFFEVFIVSQQRTGYIALLIFLCGFIALYLTRLKQKILAFSLVVLCLIVMLLTENPVSASIQEIPNEWQQCTTTKSQTDNAQKIGAACMNSTNLRLMFWQDSLTQISDYCLYGKGLGNVNLKNIEQNLDNQRYQIGVIHNPHNEYLLQGLQLGIIGMILLVVLFATTCWQALQIKTKRRYLYAGISFVYAVSCLLNSFLFDGLQSLFFVLLLAFIIAERTITQEST